MDKKRELTEIIKLMICPICRRKNQDNQYPLKLEGEKLVCSNCKSEYPIKDGIPDILEEHAKKMRE